MDLARTPGKVVKIPLGDLLSVLKRSLNNSGFIFIWFGVGEERENSLPSLYFFFSVLGMDTSNPFNGALPHGTPASTLVLEAAMSCVQAISKTKLDAEVRFHLLGKIFEGLGANPFESKSFLNPDYVCKDINKTRNSVDFSPCGLSDVEPSLSCTKIEQEKMLTSFLRKAVAHGALVLKDVNSVVQCFEETKRERASGFDDVQPNAQNHLLKAIADCCCKEKISGKREEDEHLKMKGTSHGPLDNNLPVITLSTVSLAASSPRKKDISCQMKYKVRQNFSALPFT